MIEYQDLVGKPYAYGGRGPEEYDCWGLVMEIYRRKGVELPDYERPESWSEVAKLMIQEKQAWTECGQIPGSVIHIRVGRDPHHVGIYIGTNKFIHAHEGSQCVCVERITFWERNIVGYYDYQSTA